MSKSEPVVYIVSASPDCLGWSGEAVVTSYEEGTTTFVSFEDTGCPDEAVWKFYHTYGGVEEVYGDFRNFKRKSLSKTAESVIRFLKEQEETDLSVPKEWTVVARESEQKYDEPDLWLNEDLDKDAWTVTEVTVTCSSENIRRIFKEGITPWGLLNGEYGNVVSNREYDTTRKKVKNLLDKEILLT